jgi:hypothetical protein
MSVTRVAALLFVLIFVGPVDAAERRGDATPPAAEGAKPLSPAVPAKSPEAPLDLALLEKRLKETEAIGLFTKLTLKNEVDDLLDRFRAYYEGRTEATPAELRQPYETLMLKVLTLLQDSDPSLATSIASSREAIWGILTDREKFAKL